MHLRLEPARHAPGLGRQTPATAAGLTKHVDLDQDLDRPADLTLWPGQAPARVAELRSFPTLRAALIAAAEAIALRGASPWIVTNSGDILAPNWIRAHTARVRLR